MVHIDELYNYDLVEILAAVPPRFLILQCRSVCTKWKEIIESSAFWVLKCQRMGYVLPQRIARPLDWRSFVCLPKMNRNLLSNPRARKGFDYWSMDEAGGNGWKVEFVNEPKILMLGENRVRKYFATSHRQCLKSQLIDLRKMGYRSHFMDFLQPDIIVKDWYAPRPTAGARYKLRIQLLSEDKEVLREYCPRTIVMRSDNKGQWHQISYIFHNYGEGVRYVFFQHGGQDEMLWGGWYGVRVTNSSLSLGFRGLP
uniref:FBA domain-containing protein n=1 Tax=Leptobrachium leishanense TaxID=445787 RepID=A0A8C5WGJ1_9ANUR